MFLLNFVLIVFIVVSAVAYLYFKTKQLRTSYPIRKKWYKAKASIALSIFIAAFGINTALIYNDTLAYIIGAIFILLSSSMLSSSVKRMRHEGKFIKEEYDLNNKTA
jgi:amino acid transporter